MGTIDNVRRDIARRLDEIERERDQLLKALEALTGGGGGAAPAGKRRGPGRSSRGGKRGPRPGSKRAPRGQRRQQVLDALGGQELGPSAIAREVGVNPTQISGLLRQLAAEGLVTRSAEGKWRRTDTSAAGGTNPAANGAPPATGGDAPAA